MVKAYGIHYQNGLSHPGTFVIDQQGVIRAKLFKEGYRERHAKHELLEAARAVQEQE